MSFGIAEYMPAKLEVVTSGAPLYQMIGAFFYVCFRQYKIALMVNMMSVFSVPLPFCFYFGLHQSS
jgi:hypothetical protein